jgi:hypothetical protein
MECSSDFALAVSVIANFYMEHFEQKAISTVIKKPARWYRYVDDIQCGHMERMIYKTSYST